MLTSGPPKHILPPVQDRYVSIKASLSEGKTSTSKPSPDKWIESVVHLERSKYFRKPPPLVNLGNTCYLNAILQALSSAWEIWAPISSAEDKSSLVRSLHSFLKLMKSSSVKMIPKQVLACLGSHISKSSGKPFAVNSQQDVPEILSYILNELLSCPSISLDHVSVAVKESTSCTSCQSIKSDVTTSIILLLPISSSVASAVSNVFSEPMLLDMNAAWQCAVCNVECEAIRSRSFTSAPRNLIIQLERFVKVGTGQYIRSIAVVVPSASISIQLEDGTSALYELVAEIHHSGSMQSGHYSVKSLDRSSGKWFLCNDLAISEASLSPSKSSYVLFYVLKNLNLP